jgi:hypothetical protein
MVSRPTKVLQIRSEHSGRRHEVSIYNIRSPDEQETPGGLEILKRDNIQNQNKNK